MTKRSMRWYLDCAIAVATLAFIAVVIVVAALVGAGIIKLP